MFFKMLFFSSLYIFCDLVFSLPQTVNEFYELEDAENLFEHFQLEHGKEYANDEEKQIRFEIFKNNLIDINQRNAKSEYVVFGINKFSDLTLEELNCYMGSKYPSDKAGFSGCTVVTDNSINTHDAPDVFDWRNKNVISQVKNQALCGSCWAFGAIGNIESQYALKNGKIMLFSEQQLVDCDERSAGCHGGLSDWALDSIIEMGGVMSEDDYPYTARDGSCVFNVTKAKAKLKDCTRYNFHDEDKLKELLFKNGPVTVFLTSGPLKNYKSGILNVSECPNTQPPNHFVLLVGYGTENGVDFWIIKNSWGDTWGEKGYFRITRGTSTCSILNDQMTSSILA